MDESERRTQPSLGGTRSNLAGTQPAAGTDATETPDTARRTSEAASAESAGVRSSPDADPAPGADPALDADPAADADPATDADPAAGADPCCQVCGRGGSQAELLSWVMDRRAGRVSWTCPRCAATNIRALEAKLEPEWW